ncbi:MAG: hypothetical protein LC640_12135, partial [Frankia sp.]|nr:hypothetical protein [Frankia sp.]
MRTAGYSRHDYRLIAQSYPSVAPRASENRYLQDSGDRTAHGCPMYDQDSNWARDHVVHEIGSAVRTAARDQGAEMLNLADAFQSHEFCSKFDRQVTTLDHPGPAQNEWGRILGPTSIQQSSGSDSSERTQEVFHPDAFGQQALGSCLTKAAADRPGEFVCTGGTNVAPGDMRVRRLRDVAARLGCLAGRAPIGRRSIGRVRLTRTRGQLLRRIGIRPRKRTRYSYRWCARGSHGRVAAVFSRRSGRGRAWLVVTTVRGHRARGVGRGVSVRRLQRFPRARRLMRGIFLAGPHSRRLFGVRHGRVRFVAVADRRLLHHRRALRRYLRRAGV